MKSKISEVETVFPSSSAYVPIGSVFSFLLTIVFEDWRRVGKNGSQNLNVAFSVAKELSLLFLLIDAQLQANVGKESFLVYVF